MTCLIKTRYRPSTYCLPQLQLYVVRAESITFYIRFRVYMQHVPSN